MKIQGLKELNKQLGQLAADLRPKVLKSAVRAAFKPVLASAQEKVPVDTGELRAGIVIATAQKDTTVAAGLTIVNNSAALKQGRMAAAAFGQAQGRGDPARRWHLTELGTRNQAAQPFLRPAIDENQDTVVEGLKTELDKRIKKAVKKGGG